MLWSPKRLSIYKSQDKGWEIALWHKMAALQAWGSEFHFPYCLHVPMQFQWLLFPIWHFSSLGLLVLPAILDSITHLKIFPVQKFGPIQRFKWWHKQGSFSGTATPASFFNFVLGPCLAMLRIYSCLYAQGLILTILRWTISDTGESNSGEACLEACKASNLSAVLSISLVPSSFIFNGFIYGSVLSFGLSLCTSMIWNRLISSRDDSRFSWANQQ